VPLDAASLQARGVDIATFDFGIRDLERLRGKVALEFWPPKPPREGTGIVLAGFLGQEIVTDDVGRRFGFYVASCLASQVTERHIQIDLGHGDLSDALVFGKMPYPGYDTGRMSGGPVFSLRHHRKTGLLLFTLGGVIAEG
jgi:hypothetical protein